MKKVIILMLTVVMVLSLASCGGESTEGDVKVWRLAHTEAQDTMYDMWANKFSELVFEKSNGTIQIDVYPVGALGDSATQTEMIQNGGIEICILASGDVGSTFPETQALSLNFLFSDRDEVNAAVLEDGEAVKALNESFTSKGIHVYDWFSLGNMQWTSNKPLETVDDFEGFKMRIMNTPLIAENYIAFGASPTPVPFMETYSALQLTTVDGTEQPLNAIQEMKFYEVQDYITMSNHAQMASFVAFNKAFYDSLTDEEKEIIESVKEEMQAFALESLITVQDEKFDMIMEVKPEMEVIELTDAQREEFVNASLPVRDMIVDLAGEEGKTILDLVIADIEKYEAEIAE